MTNFIKKIPKINTPKDITMAPLSFPSFSIAASSVIKRALLALSFTSVIAFSQTTLAQQSVAYTYDSNGNVLTEDGPRTDVSDVMTYAYDANGNRSSVINALGHQTQLLDYNGRGQPQRIIDANNVETLLTYHVRGWLESVTVADPTGGANSVTQYSYDNVGQLIQIALPNGVQLNYTYDAARRLTQISNSLGESINYTLDNAGNRIAETIQDNGGGITYTMTRAFDELSRVMDIIGAEGQTTHLDYDVNSNNTATTNPRTFTTDQVYDPLDRLTHTTDPDGGTTQFGYDAQDRLTSVTDANGNTTTYTYDAFDNLIQTDSPDTGTTIYQYDNANNRISMTDSRGVTVNYTYDALNRLTSVVYPSSPAENITYTYDDVQGCTSAPDAGCAGGADTNFGIGRLTQITDQSGSTQYHYDHRGNLISKTTTLNGQTYTTMYQYDLGNNPTEIAYPSGLVVRYSYDSQGRVQSVVTEQPNQAPEALVSNITYLPFGPATGMTYGNGLSNAMAYDQDYRLIALNTGSVVDMSYSYDANGNIIQIDHLNQPANDQAFGYDTLDRITTATEGGSAENAGRSFQYTYDPVGNRLTTTATEGGSAGNAGAVATYNYLLGSNQLNDIDKITNGQNSQRNFTYDNNGNPISTTYMDGGSAGNAESSFQYNAANRLVQVTTTPMEGGSAGNAGSSYQYNALGQRTQKTVTENSNTTTTYYLYNEAGQLVSEINSAGQVTRDYIYLNGQPIATLVTTISEAANDEFYLINKSTGLKLRPTDASDGSAIIATNASDNSNWTRYRQVMRSDGYFYLQNVQTGMYFRPTANTDGSGLEQRPTSYSGNRTQWSLNTADSEHQFLVNRWTGKHIRPDTNTVDGPVVQQPNTWTGSWTRWRLEPVPAVTETSTAMYYIHNDHLGTPRALTDQSQNTVWAATYTPFGEAAIQTEVVKNDLRFPGQYYDSETGFHYNWFRYYDPTTGRYITSDPIGLEGGLNTYGYAYQNPIKNFDPDGRLVWFGIPATYWIAGGAGLSAGAVCIGTNCGQAAFDAVSDAFSDDASDEPQECPQDDDNDRDCEQEWEDAYDFCDQIATTSSFGSGWSVGGSNYRQCVMGQVSERCGGNKVAR